MILPTIALVGGFLALLVLSGTFSGSETALFSLDPLQLRRFERSSSRRERLVARVIARPDRLLAGILFGNTVVNVASSSLSLALTRRWEAHLLGLDPVAVSVLGATLLILVAGEIVPKGIAVHWPERVAPVLASLLYPLLRVLAPVAGMLARVARAFLDLVGVREPAGEGMERGELRLLFEDIQEDRGISEHEGKIASNIFEFSETRAYEVMTPRVDLVGVSIDLDHGEFLNQVIAARHSRLPVYRESLDHIIGFINAKECLLEPGLPVDALLRPVHFVPERARITRILSEVQARRLNVVVVVNEYGGTSGIITQEDISEEVVGEIFDEQEGDQAPEIEHIADLTWRVAGLLSLDDLGEALGLSLPEGPAETVAGQVALLLGRPPRPGDRVEDGMVTYRVLQVRRHRAQRVEVVAAPQGGGA